MARYGIVCDECGYEDEILMPMRLWSSDKIPLCDRCGEQMRRLWDNGGRIAFQSKGKFGFVTKNMGDGPQYVHDYNDLQKKLKARGLHVSEPDRELSYRAKHMKDLG